MQEHLPIDSVISFMKINFNAHKDFDAFLSFHRIDRFLNQCRIFPIHRTRTKATWFGEIRFYKRGQSRWTNILEKKSCIWYYTEQSVRFYWKWRIELFSELEKRKNHWGLGRIFHAKKCYGLLSWHHFRQFSRKCWKNRAWSLCINVCAQ